MLATILRRALLPLVVATAVLRRPARPAVRCDHRPEHGRGTCTSTWSRWYARRPAGPVAALHRDLLSPEDGRSHWSPRRRGHSCARMFEQDAAVTDPARPGVDRGLDGVVARAPGALGLPATRTGCRSPSVRGGPDLDTYAPWRRWVPPTELGTGVDAVVVRGRRDAHRRQEPGTSSPTGSGHGRVRLVHPQHQGHDLRRPRPRGRHVPSPTRRRAPATPSTVLAVNSWLATSAVEAGVPYRVDTQDVQDWMQSVLEPLGLWADIAPPVVTAGS